MPAVVIARHPTPAAPVCDPWRDPLAVAVLDLSEERGYQGFDVEELTERAGIGRQEFEARFTDKEACAAEALDRFIVDFESRIGAVYDSYTGWRDALRATAYECGEWADEHPNLLRFGALEVLKAKNEMMRVRREEAFLFCAALIDEGRSEAEDPDAVPNSAALVGIGAIMSLVAHRLQKGQPLRIRETIPEMLYLVMRPYIGEEAAREELSAPRSPPVRP